MLVRVLERQYDEKGKQLFAKRTDVTGETRAVDKFKVYYMDLTIDEELELRATKKYSFESIRENELEKLDKKKIEEGKLKKKELMITQRTKFP